MVAFRRRTTVVSFKWKTTTSGGLHAENVSELQNYSGWFRMENCRRALHGEWQ